MKDEELQFDRTCHVLYSNPCKKQMPAMCNPDYAAMELLHARLVRTNTCAIGDKCDHTICGDRDEYLKEHPEYVDELGFKRNI